MCVKEVPADELQVEVVKTRTHQHVKRLQVIVLALVILPDQDDVYAAIFLHVLENHGLGIAPSRVLENAVKQVQPPWMPRFF